MFNAADSCNPLFSEPPPSVRSMDSSRGNTPADGATDKQPHRSPLNRKLSPVMRHAHHRLSSYRDNGIADFTQHFVRSENK